MSTLEDAMKEMESQFGEESPDSINATSADLNLDMDLLARAKAMCAAANGLSNSNGEVTSPKPSNNTNNNDKSPKQASPVKYRSPTKNMKVKNESEDVFLDEDLLLRAKAMCAAANGLSNSNGEVTSPKQSNNNNNNNKSPKQSSPVKYRSPTKNMKVKNESEDDFLDEDLLLRAKAMCAAANTVSNKHIVESSSGPPRGNKHTTPIKKDATAQKAQEEFSMDHSLLARAKAMCAAAETLSGGDPDKAESSEIAEQVAGVSPPAPVIEGWRALPGTVAVFSGSSLVTTKMDMRQKLRVGTNVMIENQVFTIAKKDFSEKSFELTEDYMGESNFEALLYKPAKSQRNKLESKSGGPIQRDKLVTQHEVLPEDIRVGLTSTQGPVHKAAASGSDAQRRALERLRRHKQQEGGVATAKQDVENEDEIEAKLNAMQKDEEKLYETRVAAMKRAREKASRQRREAMAQAQREESEAREKKEAMERQAKQLQQATKERLAAAYREKKSKEQGQSKEEMELEARANAEADAQAREAAQIAMKERRKETQRRQKKFLTLAEKVVMDEVSLLESKIKKRRDEYRDIVNTHKPLTSNDKATRDEDGEGSGGMRTSRSLDHSYENDLDEMSPREMMHPHRAAPGVPSTALSPYRGVSAPEIGRSKTCKTSKIPRRQYHSNERAPSEDNHKKEILENIPMKNVDMLDERDVEMFSMLSGSAEASKIKKQSNKKKENKVPVWRSRAPVPISQEYVPVTAQAKGDTLFRQGMHPDSMRTLTPPQEASARAVRRRQEARKAPLKHVYGQMAKNQEGQAPRIKSNSLNSPSQQGAGDVSGHGDSPKSGQKKFTSGEALASLMEQLAGQ